jgi:hypothetical protein
VGGDAFAGFRFLVPITPVVLALAFVSIEQLGRARRSLRNALVMAAFLSTPLVFPGWSNGWHPIRASVGNVELGLLMRQSLPRQAVIADFWAGSVLYFSERPGIDLLGKMDAHIARTTAHDGANVPGHNKYDFSYSLGELKPDIVIANVRLPLTSRRMNQVSEGAYAYTGRLFTAPEFVAHYRQNPIPCDTWRTVFVRDSSPVSTEVGRWKCPVAPRASFVNRLNAPPSPTRSN